MPNKVKSLNICLFRDICLRQCDWTIWCQYFCVYIKVARYSFQNSGVQHFRPYSKSSLTLNEWRFNVSFSRVSLLFLNSWRVSVVPYYVTTHPLDSQKQHSHSREAQIEPPLIEFECKWAFRIRVFDMFKLRIFRIHSADIGLFTYFDISTFKLY
jgi:hypothetical protein